MNCTLDRRLHRISSPIRGSKPKPPTRYVPRILFVDDDPDLQATFEMKMRQFAVRVDHAYFGMQGYVETVNRNPDLILMDLAMPNGNGEYLLETIKRNSATARIPVVVFTGMRDPTIRNRVFRQGADGFLQKPAVLDDLIHEIGRFIDLQPQNRRNGK